MDPLNILVIDDEAIIRQVAAKMIEKLGCRAAVASSGRQAIELFKQAVRVGDPFQATIIDINMKSGLDGLEIFARLKALDPAVQGIVSSGFSHHPAMEEYKKYGFLAAVKKPYKLKDLEKGLRKLRSIRGRNNPRLANTLLPARRKNILPKSTKY